MEKLFFNIQLFNDGPAGSEPEGTPEPTDKGLSQEQVNEILSKRLAKERSKWEKEYNQKLEKEKAEAQRLAAMDAEQRQQEELKLKIKELEEREHTLKMQESRIEAAKVLADRGLSDTFVDFVLRDDNDTTLGNINALEKAFKEAVKVEVDKRLPEFTPDGGSNAGDGSMTKEQFRALPLSKQNELYISNPEVYKTYF